MKTASIRWEPIRLLFVLCLPLGMAAGVFIGFKSLFFLETPLLRLILQYVDFPWPHVLLGSLNLLLSIALMVMLFRMYLALQSAVRKQIVPSHLLRCMAVSFGMGIATIIGYLGFMVVVMSLLSPKWNATDLFGRGWSPSSAESQRRGVQ